MSYFVYVLRCQDDSYYCGTAIDWQRRLREHLSGGKRCARYTRAHPPRALAALWECEDRSAALRLEYHFKQLRREDKRRLMGDEALFSPLLPMLERGKYQRAEGHWEAEELP